MIVLTRISGSSFVLNCDLIERVDATPDTVVSLVDGKKYVVVESLDEVMRAVRRHRSEIIALSHVYEREMQDEMSAPVPAPALTSALGQAGHRAPLSGEAGHSHLSAVSPLHPEE